MIKKYKHRGSPDALVIEAVQVDQQSIAAAVARTEGFVVKEQIPGSEDWMVGINVPTIDGMVRASEGDYIITDAGGDLHVRPQHDFEAKYEEVNEPAARPTTHPKGLKPRGA